MSTLTVEALTGLLPHTWKDQIEVIWKAWSTQHSNRKDEAVAAVRAVLDRVVHEAQSRSSSPPTLASAILQSAAREVPNQHPPPLPLRF